MTASTSVIRIWTDEKGISHIGDIEIPLEAHQYAPPADPLDVSERLAASGAVLASMPVGFFGDWHPSPRRQLYINLSGHLEVEVSDGAIRRIDPGSVVLVEDVTGAGHTTRVLGEQPATGAFVHLADDTSTA